MLRVTSRGEVQRAERFRTCQGFVSARSLEPGVSILKASLEGSPSSVPPRLSGDTPLPPHEVIGKGPRGSRPSRRPQPSSSIRTQGTEATRALLSRLGAAAALARRLCFRVEGRARRLVPGSCREIWNGRWGHSNTRCLASWLSCSSLGSHPRLAVLGESRLFSVCPWVSLGAVTRAAVSWRRFDDSKGTCASQRCCPCSGSALTCGLSEASFTVSGAEGPGRSPGLAVAFSPLARRQTRDLSRYTATCRLPFPEFLSAVASFKGTFRTRLGGSQCQLSSFYGVFSKDQQ